MSAAAKATAALDPHAVELDKMLVELWDVTNRVQGMLQAAVVIYGGLRASASCGTVLMTTTDGIALDFLIEESSCVAGKAHELAGELEEHLKAGIERPDGAHRPADGAEEAADG